MTTNPATEEEKPATNTMFEQEWQTNKPLAFVHYFTFVHADVTLLNICTKP
jgi:hypothetical protein